MINLDSRICTDFDEATRREWLETNGIGGFACGTVSGTHTRRYHGLLTGATRPPLGRLTLLSKFEETVLIDGERFDLSSNQFQDSVFPRGYEFLTGFRLDPFPVWTYTIRDIEIEKKIFMVHGKNSTVCRWSISRSNDRVELELRPLLSFVDYHHLQHESPTIDTHFDVADGCVSVHPFNGLPRLHFHHNASNVEATGYWYKNFEYSIEKERGFDYSEDLFQPFLMRFDLAESADVVVSLDEQTTEPAQKLQDREISRRTALLKRVAAADDFSKQLMLAADQFIVVRGMGHTVIAGYPWFSDWGRDTMIALSGLSLSTGRTEIAKEILVEFSRYISEGMIPNRFPDAGDQAEYNTVDATLWFFEAVREYAEQTGDYDLIRDELYPRLIDIVHWHVRGTRYNIHLDTDGLLYAGEPDVQLTWMDAKIGDFVVTPRTGKPVEIQALWYNSLRIMSDLAQRFGDVEDRAKYDAMAELAKQSFNALFWNAAEDCLFDVVNNGARDGSVRPNQIFAVSLRYSMLDAASSKKVLDKVEAELLTPVGLRSLSPRDPAFCPVYIGSPYDRDSAYHQGTVWGWLIGPFVDAYRRVYPGREDRIDAMLSGFVDTMNEAGLGQISEIFDAVAPHTPRGCFAQAWSVAEVLRVLSVR
ncbi:MAG: amylo-alpha-1,6-glucosidase [Pyrinomonadaceae bacterium]